MFLLGSGRRVVWRASQVRLASQAAAAGNPPADPSPFGDLDIRPVKRPDSAAYFMTKPKYHDLLAALSNLIQHHRTPGMVPVERRVKWESLRAMQSKLNIKMNENEYNALVKRLNQAHRLRIDNQEDRETVDAYLVQFTSGYQHIEVVNMDGTKVEQPQENTEKKRVGLPHTRRDKHGRWVASGWRKEARATALLALASNMTQISRRLTDLHAQIDGLLGDMDQAMLASGMSAEATERDPVLTPELPFTEFGAVLVNGRPLAEYFARQSDRESVIFPFEVARQLGQFNVFLQVHGGGPSGQAEACQLAVARALFSTNPSQLKVISDAGLLQSDKRVVERKKTGKPKARKSYTWVKR
ncbi:37S ribosomal protein S9, mitochondrial [Coemansia sp. RSA 2611]|nr:37S ribosomal protein S9, mitochondrial [Coemansia sp. RSA 2611]